MSITEIGRQGEIIARQIIKDYFKCDKIFQADWLFEKNGAWYIAEIKHKELFKPPPFYGHGLEAYQADMRMAFYRAKDVRCIFLVVDMDGTVYWQWLDILQQTQYFTTRNGIRVYDIKHFHLIGRMTATA
jgi:hypothetical protein